VTKKFAPEQKCLLLKAPVGHGGEHLLYAHPLSIGYEGFGL
jgi:hypothetical protein